MKIFTYFAQAGYSTCYLVSPDKGTYCVLIDPGQFDMKIIDLMKQRDMLPRAILLTHTHRSHCDGVATIQKIYKTEIYAATNMPNLSTNLITGDEDLSIGEFNFEVLSTPGHSDDSVCYALQPVIFTGDAIAAGTIGTTRTSTARATLSQSLCSKLLIRQDHEIILSGHGPPTTIGIERRFNIHLRAFEAESCL